jgi:hypothetical protein
MNKRGGSSALAECLAIKNEDFPVPECPGLDFFVEQKMAHPMLCYLTSIAVGHTVSVYWGSAEMLKGFGADVVEGEAFHQVMRWNESDGPGTEFWDNHVGERPQWYTTPEAACAAYVASYREWIAKGGAR